MKAAERPHAGPGIDDQNVARRLVNGEALSLTEHRLIQRTKATQVMMHQQRRSTRRDEHEQHANHRNKKSNETNRRRTTPVNTTAPSTPHSHASGLNGAPLRGLLVVSQPCSLVVVMTIVVTHLTLSCAAVCITAGGG